MKTEKKESKTKEMELAANFTSRKGTKTGGKVIENGKDLNSTIGNPTENVDKP